MAKGKYAKWLEADNLLLLEAWAREGLNDEDIAVKKMGISRSTLADWKNKYPDISDALKNGKEIADVKVENALFKKALGCTCTETVEELVKNPDTGKTELTVVKRTTKEIPPDTTAQIFWLKNRRPDLWREKQNVELSGEVSANPFEGLSTDELTTLVQIAENNVG